MPRKEPMAEQDTSKDVIWTLALGCFYPGSEVGIMAAENVNKAKVVFCSVEILFFKTLFRFFQSDEVFSRPF